MSSLTPRLDRHEKNYIINGNFDFWQRGTSFTTNNVYSADRLKTSIVGTGTLSRQSVSPPTGSQYYARLAVGAGSSSCAAFQTLEYNNLVELHERTITFSCKLRKSTNFTPSIRVTIQTSTSANNSSAVFTQVAATSVANASLSTGSWYLASVTYTVPAGTQGLRVGIFEEANPTSGEYYETAQWMLIIGSSAPADFALAGRNYQDELAACQRYYCKSYNTTVDPATITGAGIIEFKGNPTSTAISQTFVPIFFPVKMRANPLMTLYSPATGASGVWHDLDGAVDIAFSASGGQSLVAANNNAIYGGTNRRSRGHFTADSEL